MKRHIVTQMRVVEGATASETALLFNEAMSELACLDPTWEREGNTVWIYYRVEHMEAESLADEADLAGESIKCGACPFCIRDVNRFGDADLRKKWATCSKTGERCRIDATACEIYYRIKERGVM